MPKRAKGVGVIIDAHGVHPSRWSTPRVGESPRDYADRVFGWLERGFRFVRTRDAAFVVRLLSKVAESSRECSGWASSLLDFYEVRRDGTMVALELLPDGTLHPEPALLRGVFEDERDRYDAALDLVKPRPERSPSEIVHDRGPEPEGG